MVEKLETVQEAMMITVDIQPSLGGAPVVDLIVPVYRGLDETRRCLDSVLAFPQQTPHEIVVVNDCSPEPELSAYLRELAGTGAITLLENLVNTGFVNAVNRGMVLHPDRDVVLLNAGAALLVAGVEDSVRGGIARAAQVIDSGATRQTLDRLARASRSEGSAA